MKKRLLAFCLLFTMVCSIWPVPVLADELEENVALQEEIYGEDNVNELLDEFLPENVLDEASRTFAEDEEAEWAWQEEPSMKVARSRFSTIVIGDKIYVIGGGNTGGRLLNSVEIFDTITGTWTTGAPMPVAKGDFATAVVDDKIYVMGGWINTAATGTVYNHTNTVEIYDIESDSWSVGTPLPSYRWAGRAVAADNKIYVVAGGIGKTAPNNTVDIYDIETNTWASGASMSTGNRYYSAMVYNDGKIYIIGGSAPTAVYDIESDTWSTIPLSGAFGYCTASTSNNKIYIVAASGDFYIYDIASETLVTGPKNSYAKSHLRSSIVNGVLYVLGGETGSTMTASVSSLRLSDVQNPTPAENRLYVLLNIPESMQLSLSHNLGINLDYDWSSTDEAVATVNANGYVTAQGEGTCFIYAENDQGYRDYIPVKVIEGNADEIRLAVHLTVGGQAKLYLAEDPTDVTWTSFDDSVVSVDSEGMMTANGQGLVIVQGKIDGEEYHIYVRVNA